MSSATSIEKKNFRPGKNDGSFRLQPEESDTLVDNGFKPWHFFVLASLMLATVAVVMSRQSTPEHLVLISFTIAATGAAAAGFYRMLAPLASEDASVFSEPLTERSRLAIEREKALTMRSIKELEFDSAMGKLSPKDFDEMAGRLRARAIALMKQLDEGGSAYREIIERELSARVGASLGDRNFRVKPEETKQPEADTVPGTCVSCGTSNDHDAAFCKRCGTKLQAVPLDRARGKRS
jgi:hypothetical protein